MVESVEKAPLEDLMAAMDVVDTLRHQQGIAERELDGEGRRARLLERLREMYRGQGIDVPDRVFEEGIDALEQERFQYKSVAPSWRTRLAHMWVSRGRWGKPVGFLAVVGSLFSGVYFATDVLPEWQLKSSLPEQLQTTVSSINSLSKNPTVTQQAAQSAALVRSSLDKADYKTAQSLLEAMKLRETQLSQSYDIRILSRAGQDSGFWRTPPNNPSGRNYYIVVEAIDRNNQVIELTILNQENNRSVRKKAWALRVNEKTFFKIVADKKDDGIIQGNIVGKKEVGYLIPTFNIPTTGATITEW